MKKIYIPIFVFISLAFNTVGQEKSRKEKQGDKYVFSYSFTKAIDSYTQSKDLTPAGQRHLADSYQKIEKNVEAEVVYAKLINNTNAGLLPEDYYNYAMVLKSNGKYEESNKWMDKFVEQKADDLRAKNYTANKGELENLQKDDGKYKVETLSINTNAEDFGTTYYKDKIVFSSSRATAKMIQRKDNWSGKPFLDMYVSDMDGVQLKEPAIFDKNLNSKMHDGTASFNKDGTYVAFSTNNAHRKNKGKVVQIQIYFSNYKDGKWSKEEPFALNSADYSVGLPCLTSDGNTMFFTSDMPGGFGKADIYKTTRNDKGEWGKPENMGNKINTEGNELFPFYEETNSILFFASNGLFGLGGLDIFYTSLSKAGVGSVYNAGFPLNTKADDFAAIVNGAVTKGYFSSDREGGSGDDDMYAFDILKGLKVDKNVEGFAKDKNGSVIPNTFITILDDKDKVVDTLTTKDDGAFTFLVNPDKNFKLVGKKQNYIDGDSVINTFGKDFSVKADVILLPKADTVAEKTVEEQIVAGADLGKILKFNPDKIYFDVNKFNLRPDAETELNYIVKVMNDHPSMIVELGAYTDCRASEAYNQTLSDKRARASADYIKKRITNPKRISGKGYGETKLVNSCACEDKVVSNCTDEEHQKNRRTEFIIIKE